MFKRFQILIEVGKFGRKVRQLRQICHLGLNKKPTQLLSRGQTHFSAVCLSYTLCTVYKFLAWTLSSYKNIKLHGGSWHLLGCLKLFLKMRRSFNSSVEYEIKKKILKSFWILILFHTFPFSQTLSCLFIFSKQDYSSLLINNNLKVHLIQRCRFFRWQMCIPHHYLINTHTGEPIVYIRESTADNQYSGPIVWSVCCGYIITVLQYSTDVDRYFIVMKYKDQMKPVIAYRAAGHPIFMLYRQRIPAN